MLFDVEIMSTTVRRVQIEADNIFHAREAAKGLEKTGAFREMPRILVKKEYAAYYHCDQCNKPVSFYFSLDNHHLCVSCYKKLARG